MSGPAVTRGADREEVAQRAAEVFATTADAARTVHGAAHVALSGGSTVGRVYELAGPMLPDWRDVHLWFGDERMVAPDDEESNYRLSREHLDAPGATWHPVPTELPPEEAAAAYGRELAGVTLDLAVNGMGPDGHTASLFPGFDQVQQRGVCFAVHGSPKPPPERITLSMEVFNAARRSLLVVPGADKAPMLARVLERADPAVPASLLERDVLEIVADTAALDG